MKKLLYALLTLFIIASAPASAQFGACLPGFCGQPVTNTCVNSGHAAAFLARTSGLDGTHVTAYTNLLNSLDADGLSCLFDFLYIPATQDSTTARLNLISSNFTATVHGAVTFTADRGFSGADGSATIYADTNFNPTTQSATSKFQLNNAHLSVWNLTNATSTQYALGAVGASNNTAIFSKYSDNNAYFRVNINGIGNPVAIGSPLGYFFANHRGVNNDPVHNGVNAGTFIDTSLAVLNLNFYIVGFNNNGTPSGSGNITAAASAGADFTATQYANIYTHLRTYMTAVGVP